ncbi:MAG: sulfur carrier protein ThiS [Beijerinckiaceae bacterium]|jgi:sulfur carrier protein|nr:sulfur carrier protein ThiS [Beijerinckiaceae bacterium]MDO9442365.1 sulfur carrier protein ThiS [Beijerinckiaceae bacterium]
MNIVVNGQSRDIAAGRLDQALDELGYGDAVVATAVNGDFVRVIERADRTLAEGDKLEVLAPMQGG